VNEKELIIRVAVLVLGGIGLGLLAKRKNRNPWLWGAIGGACALLAPLLLLVPLLVVGFLRYKCPKCGASISNDQARSSQCPACTPQVETPA
jgi:rubrerythrin